MMLVIGIGPVYVLLTNTIPAASLELVYVNVITLLRKKALIYNNIHCCHKAFLSHFSPYFGFVAGVSFPNLPSQQD